VAEYPNASHAFDNPLGPVPPAAIVNGQSVRHCVIREEPAGLLINAIDVKQIGRELNVRYVLEGSMRWNARSQCRW
jgi:hypothetical protein